MRNETLVACLLTIDSALQLFLPRMPLMKVKGVDVVVEVVRYVKYFISYALYSEVIATLTSSAVIFKFMLNSSLITVIKYFTP